MKKKVTGLFRFALLVPCLLLGAAALYGVTHLSGSGKKAVQGTVSCDYDLEQCQTVYLAGGCFWGTEHYLKTLDGVVSTRVGYALGDDGTVQSPPQAVTYRQVCAGSGHSEAVEVVYDPTYINLDTLLKEYAYTIDPTSVNRQGNDWGIQYRTGIYTTTQEQHETAAAFLTRLQTQYDAPLAVENLPLLQFIAAEDYHQDYLEKNPGGYCHIDFDAIARKKEQDAASSYRMKTDAELREQLTPLQYEVTQQGGTEPPFQNEYWDTEARGIYVDITTGEPLFRSSDKFISGCGWPAFSRPIKEELLTEHEDTSYGMRRIEVRSRTGDAHLGHVFEDGPVERGGLRYCINSAALRFIPEADMEREGYGDLIPLLDE